MAATEVDADGNDVLSLERKSVQPYRTQDEYLYAMKEDLAEWFNTLYTTNVTVDDFFDYLDTGVVLCQHANKVNVSIVDQIQNGRDPINGNRDTLELAKQAIQYRASVKPGSFQCRDNISNYIQWCRRTLGIPDTLLFESDDLVMRKNERNVVLCVLEVARRGARYGMLAPVLVQLEEEIDAEIAGKEPPRPKRQRPRRTIDMMSLDEMVRNIAKQCTCPDTFPIIRVSEGKYKVGESLTLIFVRILRNHVMVRIGGGWDTLENYLNRHDPCRCQAGKRQHRTPRYSQPSAKRRASMTSPAPGSDAIRSPRQLPATPNTHPSSNSTSGGDGNSPRSQVVRRNSSCTPRSLDRVRLSDDTSPGKQRPQSAKAPGSRPQSPSVSRRAQSPSPRSSSTRPQSPLPSRRARSPANTAGGTQTSTANRKSSLSGQNYSGAVPGHVIRKPEPIRPQPRRPASAGPTSHQNIHNSLATGPHVPALKPRRLVLDESNPHPRSDEHTGRARSVSRDNTVTSHHVRSHSVGADQLRKHFIKGNQNSGSISSNDVIMISRDKSGRHMVNKPDDSDTMNVTMSKTNGSTNGTGNGERRLNSNRMKISPDKLLPSKPKTIMRSQSVEAKLLLDQVSSVPGSCVSINSDTSSDRPVLRRQSSVGSIMSLGSAADLAHIQAPVADHRLNKEMEKVFEEYRRAEKGWFHYDDADQEVDMLTASASSVKSAPGVLTGSNRSQSTNSSRNYAPTTSKGSFNTSGRNTPTHSRKSSISESSSSSSLSGGRVRPRTPSSQRPVNTSSTTSRRSPTPSSQRRSVTPTLSSTSGNTPRRGSLSNTPRRDSNADTSSNTSYVSRSSSTRRNSSGVVSRPRSQTPNPTPSTPQVRVQARCRTPVIQARIEGATPRIDTGLRKRPTTPSADVTPRIDTGLRKRPTTPSADVTPRIDTGLRKRPTTPSADVTPRIDTGLRKRPTTPSADVTPRIDTGLRKRPTTPSADVTPRIDTGLRKRPNTPSADVTPQRRTVPRSSSLSRVAINKAINGASGDITVAMKKRSRSKEDILDCSSSDRPSRSDVDRRRDTVVSGRRSSSRDYRTQSGTEDVSNNDVLSADRPGQALREPPRSLPPTPGMLSTAPPPQPVSVQIPALTSYVSTPQPSEGAYAARPRKDECVGLKTRIPCPSSVRSLQSPIPEAGALKRFDSGVEINISPTENSSIQEDEDMFLPWQQSEAVSLGGQALGYSLNNAADEYY